MFKSDLSRAPKYRRWAFLLDSHWIVGIETIDVSSLIDYMLKYSKISWIGLTVKSRPFIEGRISFSWSHYRSLDVAVLQYCREQKLFGCWVWNWCKNLKYCELWYIAILHMDWQLSRSTEVVLSGTCYDLIAHWQAKTDTWDRSEQGGCALCPGVFTLYY